MNIIRRYIGDLFFTRRMYVVSGVFVCLYILAFLFPALLPAVNLLFLVFLVICLGEYVNLFFISRQPAVRRLISDRLSNGDDNRVKLLLQNRMKQTMFAELIDELPEQLQERNFLIRRKLAPLEKADITYVLRPTERGVYEFGRILLYLQSVVGLMSRRFSIPAERSVSVYPSFMHFRQYQLVAQAAQLNEAGAKRIRKIGQSMEFEQIKEYVPGDDLRTINWKATARKGGLMVNSFVEEKSQQVYCILDKGRLMKMPFQGMTLLDHAINSTLVMADICLHKQDRVGLMTFGDKMGSLVAADRKPVQRDKIMQILYKQQTGFLESDFEMLYMQIRNKIKQRSLLILYTNIETMNGLKRRLPYLRSIARYHLLLVVFFENSELSRLSQANAENLEDVYIKTIAEKFLFEKKLIVRELQKYGILSLLTKPENLTVQTVNKYLELKNKQAL